MPNIRILAKAVLQIFCSQVVPIQNACVQNRGITHPKSYGIDSKVNSFHLNLGLYLFAKYQDPSQNGSSYILFTRLFLYKMPMSEKGE